MSKPVTERPKRLVIRRRRRSRGQSLVEFALVLPVMLFIVAVALDFGRAFMGWVSLTGATRLGANYAAQHPDADWGNASDPDRLRYVAMMTRDLQTTNCVPATTLMPSYPNGTDLGDAAVVSLTCDFRPVTPIVSAVLGNTVRLSASTAYPVRSDKFAPPAPTPTPTPTPSPSPSPSPDPSPSPGVSPSPSAAPSPSPAPCYAPDFIDQRVADAQNAWRNAGFTTTVVTLPGNGNYKIGQQDKIGGQPYACTTTIVTVGP